MELVPAGRTPVTPDTASFDASAHVVLPGLINTHHHFFQTLTRATPAALDRELFPWLQALYPIWARLTPEALDLAATLAMSELLLSGCTTSTDHHYVFPEGLAEAIDIEITAAKALGIRVVLTRGSMNLSQRDGGLPPDSVVQDEDAILADSQRLIERYHQRGEDAMVQIALAPCSPFSVTTSLMRSTAELASRKQVRLHTHLAETEDENRYCQEIHGRRPLDYLEDSGWLGERTWLAHGIHFNADEMVRLARAGTTISHCPCSNQVLASGGCPVCDLERAGVRVGIGVDVRVKRRFQSDPGSARRVPDSAQPLWRLGRQSSRCIALGDERFGSLYRPSGARRNSSRQDRRPRALQVGRASFLRCRRPAGRACIVRRPQGGSRHDRRRVGGRGGPDRLP